MLMIGPGDMTLRGASLWLELVPQVLVVNFVVELILCLLDVVAEQTRATIR